MGLVRDPVAMGLFSKRRPVKPVGSIATSQLHGPRFDPELLVTLVTVCVKFHKFLHSVYIGLLQLLQLPPTVQNLAGMQVEYAKLPFGMNENVNVCLHGAL